MNTQEKMFTFFAALILTCTLKSAVIINPSTTQPFTQIPTLPDVQKIRVLCENLRKKIKRYRTAHCMQKRPASDLKKRASSIKNTMPEWQKKPLKKHIIIPNYPLLFLKFKYN